MWSERRRGHCAPAAAVRQFLDLHYSHAVDLDVNHELRHPQGIYGKEVGGLPHVDVLDRQKDQPPDDAPCRFRTLMVHLHALMMHGVVAFAQMAEGMEDPV